MRRLQSFLLALLFSHWTAEAAQYLPTIQQRWDASDLVCIGDASSPVLTGLTRTIDGSNRDQLSAAVKLEECFKGVLPTTSEIRVLGYSAVATNDIVGGYAYGGPPVGFVSEGRNLLFLLRTNSRNEFQVAVPIYQTAIHLADVRPGYTTERTAESDHHILTQEFEAALVQFDDGDLSDVDHILDLLGNSDGISELERFSLGAPQSVQRDIAVTLLSKHSPDREPVVISLLLDSSAPVWKRENAAEALGEYGTEAALAPLRQIASQHAATDDLKSLQVWAGSSLHRLEGRLQNRLLENDNAR